MTNINHYQTSAQKRAKRVRGKLFGTADRPRISVYRSNKYTYVQAIDDASGKTVAAANELTLNKGAKKPLSGTKLERAAKVGDALAKELKKQKVTKAIFDRGSYRYHGRVKAIAEALRASGVEV